jgi:hypothetical protein
MYRRYLLAIPRFGIVFCNELPVDAANCEAFATHGTLRSHWLAG